MREGGERGVDGARKWREGGREGGKGEGRGESRVHSLMLS